jgi:hypothetical protein
MFAQSQIAGSRHVGCKAGLEKVKHRNDAARRPEVPNLT